MEIEKPFHELEEHGLRYIITILQNNTKPKQSNASTQCEDKNITCNGWIGQSKTNHNTTSNSKTNHNAIGEFYTAIIWILAKLTDSGRDNKTFEHPKVRQLQYENLVMNITNF